MKPILGNSKSGIYIVRKRERERARVRERESESAGPLWATRL